jgi:hypothetical protein
VTALRWHTCPAPAGPRTSNGVCVRIANAGNRRVKVRSLTVAGDGWQQSLNLQEAEAVLAGDEREWTVPAAAAGALQSVQVRTATGEILHAEKGG